LSPEGILTFSTFFGGTASDFCVGVSFDDVGSAYVAGTTESSDFPTLKALQGTYGGGFGDAFAAKLTAGGILEYSTYFGGLGDEQCRGIATDGNGSACITGSTTSPDLPTLNAPQPFFSGGATDVFVARLTMGGALAYATFIGGTGEERGNGIAADRRGNIYLTGYTESPDFPLLHASQYALAGTRDAFVTRISENGAIAYSTYLGGRDNDEANAIAADTLGNAYITGTTGSLDFPTVRAMQPSYAGGTFEAFVTRLDGSGAQVNSSYLGGSQDDLGFAISADASGDTYAMGFTSSVDFPTASPAQAANAGWYDTFVTKIALGSSLGVPYQPEMYPQLAIVQFPTADEILVSVNLLRSGSATFELFSSDGRRVGVPIAAKEYEAGRHVERISTAGLAAGSYSLLLETLSGWQAGRFVVMR
jgi:hypothetical protein